MNSNEPTTIDALIVSEHESRQKSVISQISSNHCFGNTQSRYGGIEETCEETQGNACILLFCFAVKTNKPGF
jgi:hypothetical protein